MSEGEKAEAARQAEATVAGPAAFFWFLNMVSSEVKQALFPTATPWGCRTNTRGQPSSPGSCRTRIPVRLSVSPEASLPQPYDASFPLPRSSLHTLLLREAVVPAGTRTLGHHERMAADRGVQKRESSGLWVFYSMNSLSEKKSKIPYTPPLPAFSALLGPW